MKTDASEQTQANASAPAAGTNGSLSLFPNGREQTKNAKATQAAKKEKDTLAGSINTIRSPVTAAEEEKKTGFFFSRRSPQKESAKLSSTEKRASLTALSP